MALIEIRKVNGHARLGLWKMDETPEALLAQFPHLAQLHVPYKSDSRQREFLAVRALLATMTGDTSLLVDHLPSGKPVVEGYYASISHTRGYAVLMLSQAQPVAVDIEQRSDRVQRIASRFIRRRCSRCGRPRKRSTNSFQKTTCNISRCACCNGSRKSCSWKT